MVIYTVNLDTGIELGGKECKEVQLREPTAQDFIEASRAAERVSTITNERGEIEPVIVPSPTDVSIEMLRRQIVRIGDVECDPMQMSDLFKLSAKDLQILMNESEALESAASREVTRRGRDSARVEDSDSRTA